MNKTLAERVGYTAGKWTLYNKPGTTAILIDGNQHKSLIQWDGFDSSSTPIKERGPNGRLIAAAPQMLEALVVIIKSTYGDFYAKCSDEGWNDDECKKKSLEWIKPWAEIIESATGMTWADLNK